MVILRIFLSIILCVYLVLLFASLVLIIWYNLWGKKKYGGIY